MYFLNEEIIFFSSSSKLWWMWDMFSAKYICQVAKTKIVNCNNQYSILAIKSLTLLWFFHIAEFIHRVL